MGGQGFHNLHHEAQEGRRLLIESGVGGRGRGVCEAGAGTVGATSGANEVVGGWNKSGGGGWGVGEWRFRTDREQSMTALAAAVEAKRGGHRTLREEAPEASQQSIGGVERFHFAVQEQCSTLRLDMVLLSGKELKLTAPLAAWIVPHASWLLFRFAINKEL